MEATNLNSIKRSLRNVNSCFKVPNLFRNKNSQFLTQNIEFIPKHIRRKIVEKQNLLCKDILDLEFNPQRPKVDIITVKTALKLQSKYQNILHSLDQTRKNQSQMDEFIDKSTKKVKMQHSDVNLADSNQRKKPKINYQALKSQIPTSKQLKRAISE